MTRASLHEVCADGRVPRRNGHRFGEVHWSSHDRRGRSVRIGKRNRITGRVALACAIGVFALTVSLAGAGVGSRSTRLEAGVGVADITPDLGRNFDGYVRPDILAKGVATRLWARTLVLTRGPRKIALVSVDLVGALGDMHRALAGRVADLGLSENTILLLGSHTHSGPDMMINTTSTPRRSKPATRARTSKRSWFNRSPFRFVVRTRTFDRLRSGGAAF
ncbi:MAG: hypothetical protein E6G46_08830 [Actinobacteria bacterium]|nr:MAG: hypothetical protein E6G46_08830 [Actinomycetota bacterium]